jgi:hypothetical protein
MFENGSDDAVVVQLDDITSIQELIGSYKNYFLTKNSFIIIF